MVNFAGFVNRRSRVQFPWAALSNYELNQHVADTSETQDVVPKEADDAEHERNAVYNWDAPNEVDDAERERNAVYNWVAFR